tara:strand:- start:215 stop:478 length:264 start_codon:yes stop_codon:yes gene_type:complete
MDIDNIIIFVAVTIGIAQILNDFNKIYNMKDVKNYNMNEIIAGIIASVLWTIYQYRKGSNYYALYSVAGALLGFYTLKKIYDNQEEV